MKPLLTTLLAMLCLSSGIYLAAGSLMDLPPTPAPAPPVPPPAPSPPGPALPPKPMEKRCGLDTEHHPHLWTDKAGLIYHCDGGAEFRPPGNDPPPPKS